MSERRKEIIVEIKENWYKNLLPKFDVKKITIIENKGNIKIHKSKLFDVNTASNHIGFYFIILCYYDLFDRKI